MNEEQFKQAVYDAFNIELTEKQMAQFRCYYELLIEWNQKMNLTAITNKEDVYLKHFFDSLTLLRNPHIHSATTLCDVGAGAGFPSIPLKIVCPNLEVTIVDSLNKRITFLNHLAEQLELEHVYFCHDRAETFGKNEQYRESFDVVTARAVARLNVLLELCVPLAKVDGYFIALKASQGKEEVAEAQRALNELSTTVEHIDEFTLPVIDDERVIITCHKKAKTKKRYPRKPGTPNKQPLS